MAKGRGLGVDSKIMELGQLFRQRRSSHLLRLSDYGWD